MESLAFEPVVLIVSREEVETGDYSGAQSFFAKILEGPESIVALRERVNIAFAGYDEDRRELHEIEQVRDFVAALDGMFPFWLYFLSREYSGLQCIALCLLPPFLTPEARQRIHGERLEQILTARWVPALSHICASVGVPDDVADAMTNSAVDYFISGPWGRRRN